MFFKLNLNFRIFFKTGNQISGFYKPTNCKIEMYLKIALCKRWILKLNLTNIRFSEKIKLNLSHLQDGVRRDTGR